MSGGSIVFVMSANKPVDPSRFYRALLTVGPAQEVIELSPYK